MPEAASAVKVSRIRALDARVTVTGALYADAYDACLRTAAASDALFIHAYDQPEVVAGAGTLGRELMTQADVDTVLVAVGGGGLAAGVRLGVGAGVKLVAVEPEQIPTLHAALAAGGPVDVEVSGVAADALGARRIGHQAFEIFSAHQVHSVLVADDAISAARQLLWDQLQLAVEPAGATAAAALLSGVYVPEPGERVAVVICGANTDPSDLVAGNPL